MMLRKFCRAAAICAALLTLAAPARADVVISQSNDPHLRLKGQLSSLLGTDPPVVEPRRGNVLERLMSGRLTGPDTPPEIDYSFAFVDEQPAATGGADWHCLSEALYFEARGERVKGIFAVAEVIMNRVESTRFPSTVCGVVKQGTGRKYECQFTYNCDGAAEAVHEPRAWRRVGKIARLVLDGAPRPLTGGATYYHTRTVKPRWSRRFDRTATIGAHYFYSTG